MTQASEPKALITGATGFVGRHLAERLSLLEWSVDVLVRPTSDLACLSKIPNIGVHIYDGSAESVAAAVKASSPDVVFHLATHFVAEHTADEIDSQIEGNIRFGVHLLQAMSDAGVLALVNTGTSWQNFNDSVYRPVNFYAATKQAFEDVLAYYTDACGLRAVTLRLFDTYGPHDPRRKLFWALLNAAESGKTLQMSPGEQKLDLVYIDDVVRACEMAARHVLKSRAAGHEVYAVSGQNQQPLKSVVEMFETVLGKTLSISWGGRDYREREVMTPWTSGQALPGWEPEIGLEEGIRKMLGHDV